MSPDLYDAWRAAGAWLAANWNGLAAFGVGAAVLTLVVWAVWPSGDDYRTRNDRVAAAWTATGPRPEPAEPGVDDRLLAACQQICPELARKEER